MTETTQEAEPDLVGVPESRAGILTLLDFASLRRGLELLPERRAEVLAHFELDEELGRPEIDRWNTWLASHPEDEEECAGMAERMTDYWRRWDKTTPVRPTTPEDEEQTPDPKEVPLEFMAKLSAGLETLPDRRTEVFVALGIRTHDEQVDMEIALDRLKSGPDLDVKRFLAARAEATPFWQRWLSPPTLSMVDYARLALDLERGAPGDPTTIYRAHRLDRVNAEREISLWKKRLAESKDEAARYEQVREQLVRSGNAPPKGPAEPQPMKPMQPMLGAQSARIEPAAARRPLTQAPMTARAVVTPFFTRTPVTAAPVVIAPTLPSFTSSNATPAPRKLTHTPATEPPPIGLLEYTVLCLQLELDEGRAELHYRRLGLVNQAHRDHAHAYWQARFALDPSARQEWIDQARRLRANWHGSRE